jgi:hypothetical protein
VRDGKINRLQPSVRLRKQSFSLFSNLGLDIRRSNDFCDRLSRTMRSSGNLAQAVAAHVKAKDFGLHHGRDAQIWLGLDYRRSGSLGARFIQREIVRSETSKPSMRSSP